MSCPSKIERLNEPERYTQEKRRGPKFPLHLSLPLVTETIWISVTIIGPNYTFKATTVEETKTGGEMRRQQK
jgi:hypothetical protein